MNEYSIASAQCLKMNLDYLIIHLMGKLLLYCSITVGLWNEEFQNVFIFPVEKQGWISWYACPTITFYLSEGYHLLLITILSV